MKSAGKARSNGLYRHIRTSKEIIRNLLNYCAKNILIICGQLLRIMVQINALKIISNADYRYR